MDLGDLPRPRLALVTGANGFIGSHLCRALVSAGVPVRAMLQPGTAPGPISDLPVEIHYADLTRRESLLEALKGVSHVFHLAAYVNDWGPRETFRRVNHMGTLHLLHAAHAMGAERFLLTSSLAVHAYTGHSGTDETAPLNATINEYARSKIAAEEIVSIYGRAGKLETVIVRPGLFPYGPGDRKSFFQLASAIEKGGYAHLNGGRARVGLAYVENLAEGMIRAGLHPAAKGEVFILADDDSPTWRQIAEDIADGLGTGRPRLSLPYGVAWIAAAICEVAWRLFRGANPPLTFYRIGVPRRDLVFSNAKAKRLLGFAPRVGWKEGLERTLAWYRAEKEASK